MFWLRAYPLCGEVGGGWALEFPSFLGPVKWERADRRVPFGAQKTREFQGPTPSGGRSLIRIDLVIWLSWIRIRIPIRNADPELDPGARKLTILILSPAFRKATRW
jgi:hypothetical protein